MESLFNELSLYFSEHLYLLDGDANVLAVWTVYTWMHELFTTAPYLCLESATPGCGKTVALDLLAGVVARGLHSTGISRAALMREMDQGHKTLLLDESEVLAGSGDRGDGLKSVLQAGYRQGATFQVMEGGIPRKFKVFGPKAFAAIGGLTGPLLDRSIIIRMLRAPEDFEQASCSVEDLQPVARRLRKAIRAELPSLKERVAAILRRRPPHGYWPEFRNREADLWHPLLTVARALGKEVEAALLRSAATHRERKAGAALGDPRIAQGLALLEVLRTVKTTWVKPGELVESLRPAEAWAEIFERREDAVCAARIGNFLRTFHLQSRQRPRGATRYRTQEIIAALEQHLPMALCRPGKSATTATTATTAPRQQRA